MIERWFKRADRMLAVGETEGVWMIDNADVAGAEASAGIPAIIVRKRRESAKRYCEDLSGVLGIVEGATR